MYILYMYSNFIVIVIRTSFKKKDEKRVISVNLEIATQTQVHCDIFYLAGLVG